LGAIAVIFLVTLPFAQEIVNFFDVTDVGSTLFAVGVAEGVAV
jgi:hypothetical protein